MTIKFITLNVWHGGKLLDPMLAFLEQENPDILVLQESYNESDPSLPPQLRTIEQIQNRLHYAATDFAGSFRQSFPGQDYTAVQGYSVLSRFAITSTKSTFFNRPFDEHYVDIPENFPTISRCLQHVTLDTPSGELNVFNFQGVWDLAGDRDSPDRRRMADVIIEQVQGKPRVILAGDTNATPDNPAIKRIEQHLTSVFAGELTTSFNMRRKTNPGYATAVVDMIFTSSDITPGKHYCPDIDVSDHLPLVAMLDF